MKKILAAVLRTEPAGCDVRSALGNLPKDRDMLMYATSSATSVIVEDSEGALFDLRDADIDVDLLDKVLNEMSKTLSRNCVARVPDHERT